MKNKYPGLNVKKYERSKIIILFWIIISAYSCNIINPEEKIPAYIKVDSVSVSTTTDQGTTSHNIKDVWAYMDGQLIGVFELPALFPVIGDQGKHSFLFAPGIYDNGIASTHIIYRLMKGASTELDIINGAITNVTAPQITYFPGVSFDWLENFEDGTVSIVSDDSLDILTVDTLNAFEGKSAKLSLNATNNSFKFRMFEGVQVPAASVTYAELNYKCDQPFFLGLAGKKTGGYTEVTVILINASENWNKIYVNIGDAVRVLNPSADYKVFCYSTLGNGISSGTFYFDNFKLIHN